MVFMKINRGLVKITAVVPKPLSLCRERNEQKDATR